MTYRDPAGAPALEFESNEPNSNHPAAGIIIIIVAALAMTAGLMWGPDDWRIIIVAMGVFFIGAGAFTTWRLLRDFRKIVRVSLTGDQVTIEWLRRGQVIKTQRIARADVVEVVVTDAPSSGLRENGLAIGLRNGEIELSDGKSLGALDFHAPHCAQLAAFLGVPSRLP